jgi:phage terminase large subunit-like protein
MKPELKIYFTGAIRVERAGALLYSVMISLLKGFSALFTEHVGDQPLRLDKERDK